MNIRKALWLALGCTGLALGALGAVLPLLMLAGFVMMHAVPVGRVVLAAVWLGHVLYFTLGVRTLGAQE